MPLPTPLRRGVRPSQLQHPASCARFLISQDSLHTSLLEHTSATSARSPPAQAPPEAGHRRGAHSMLPHHARRPVSQHADLRRGSHLLWYSVTPRATTPPRALHIEREHNCLFYNHRAGYCSICLPFLEDQGVLQSYSLTAIRSYLNRAQSLNI